MQNRKEEIRAAAAKLFRKKGYGATSMRDIAELVGIKAASIYNHFSGKQELLQDLLMRPAYLYTAEMQTIKKSELSAEEKLSQLIKHHVYMATNHTDPVGLIVTDWAHLEGETRIVFFKLREDYEQDFSQIIEDGKNEGSFSGDLNTEIAVFSMLSTLRWLFSWYNRNKDFDINELEKQAVKILLKGME